MRDFPVCLFAAEREDGALWIEGLTRSSVFLNRAVLCSLPGSAGQPSVLYFACRPNRTCHVLGKSNPRVLFLQVFFFFSIAFPVSARFVKCQPYSCANELLTLPPQLQ